MLTSLHAASTHAAWINAGAINALVQRYGDDVLTLCMGSYLARLSARQVKLMTYAECGDRTSLMRDAHALYEESTHYGCVGLAYLAAQLWCAAERNAVHEVTGLIALMPQMIQHTRVAFKHRGVQAA